MQAKNQSQLATKLLLQDEIIVVKEIPDEELSKHEEINILEVFMKYGDDPNFPQWLIAHPDIAQQLAENKYIERAIAYLLEVGHNKEEDLLKAFKKTSNKLKETMLTTRQQIEQRGIEQGIKQGIEQERFEIAKQMLSKGLDMQFICEITGLSEAKINALNSCY